MRILSCQVSNFASYKNLEFTFDNQGLTLISGPTGSGKSTLCDIVPWILFGKTAKGGTVDEICTWGTIETTEGELIFEINGKVHTINRLRTKKSQDLYYDNTSASRHRGKDIVDTQKQINNILGFDYELYMSAAYFHEFSTTAQFFTTTAKIRRQITEQLVDLNLAKKLQERASDYKKEVKKEQEKLSQYIALKKTELTHINKLIASLQNKTEIWNEERDTKFERLQSLYRDFEDNKQKAINKIIAMIAVYTEEIKDHSEKLTNIKHNKDTEKTIEALTISIEECNKEKCVTCGAPKQNNKKLSLVQDLHRFKSEKQSMEAEIVSLTSLINRIQKTNESYFEQLSNEKNRENTYLQQLKDVEIAINPYYEQLEETHDQSTLINLDLEGAEKDLEAYNTEYGDLELLLDVADTFRSFLVRQTVVDLETQTNKILHDCFDAEIQVKFEISDTDKLEVTIQKDGHEASFTQLSKGQRQLLKMSFGVSVMTCVSNHHGIDFNCIFLDEFTDGLDEALKIRTFDLLQSLALKHESVFVIEHNETAKSMFPKRYSVELVNGESQIEEA